MTASTLNGREKRELLGQGIVLCKTIFENPGLLLSIGIDNDKKEKILDEITGL